METTKYGKHEIKMWVTADELPIDRWTAFNKYLMLDGIIGNSFEDIDGTHLRTISLLHDDKEKQLQAIQNLRELIFAIENRVNYQHHAFAVFVHSIDDKLTDDISDSGIKDTLAKLAKIGVTNSDIKKKTIVQGILSTAR